MKNFRTRNWATIMYEDSCNVSKVVSQLRTRAIQFCLSPKHVDPDKKPHYHLFLMFENVKSFEQVKLFLSGFGCVGCESVQNKVAYARYLCHLDNPEKVVYSTSDVVCNLCDYDALIKDYHKDANQDMLDLIIYMSTSNAHSVRQLVDELMCDAKYDLIRYVTAHAFFVREYLKD